MEKKTIRKRLINSGNEVVPKKRRVTLAKAGRRSNTKNGR